MNNPLLRIPERYLAYVALTIWGALCLAILNKTSYGIDEGAARALLLVWSVVDNVVSPVVTSGFPDFRTAFLVPVGILWTGNVLAAKIFAIFLMACAVWAIHTWRRLSGNSESALLASGLLLISPLVIDQIETISVAPFLLVIFALGAWTDKIYRDAPLLFGGWYFTQLFLCLVSTSLHPAGLAYPLILLWAWYKSPVEKQRNYFFGGIVFSVLFSLALTLGWHHIEWFSNPITSLSSLFMGSGAGKDIGAVRWIIGIGVAVALLLVIWKQAANLWTDLLGRILLAGLAIGMLAGDETWSIIALTICLYWGLALMLQMRTSPAGGFWGQRGMALSLVFIISTAFMLADRAHYQQAQAGTLTPRDKLIKTLTELTLSSMDESNQSTPNMKPALVASQWPGRTMVACRCGAFPLPPPAKDEQEQFLMLRGVNYLIFDPHNPDNKSLSRNLAMMNAEQVETISLQEGGVIIEIKESAPAKAAM